MRGGENKTNKETNTKTKKNTNKTANIKTNTFKQQERMWNPIVISREGREEREKSRRSGMLQRVSSISTHTLNRQSESYALSSIYSSQSSLHVLTIFQRS